MLSKHKNVKSRPDIPVLASVCVDFEHEEAISKDELETNVELKFSTLFSEETDFGLRLNILQ